MTVSPSSAPPPHFPVALSLAFLANAERRDALLADTRARLAAAEDTLDAIRRGEVDALVVYEGSPTAQVFTLSGADRPYRIFVENMYEGAATISDGVVLYANRRLGDLLSLPPSTIVGAPIVSFVAAGDVDALTALMAPGGQNESAEVQLRHGDGPGLPVLVGRSLLDVDGEVLTCLTFTDLKQQRESAEATARLAAIVDSSDDAIIGVALDGSITSWNSTAGRLFGYVEKDVLGRSVGLLAPAESATDLPDLLRRVAAGERVEQHETVRVTAAGRRVSVSLAVSPIRDVTGTTIGVAMIMRDITERQRDAEEFKAQQTQTRLILETASDAFVGMDRGGRVVDWNRRAESTFGWSHNEAVGRLLAELIIPARFREAHRQGLLRLLSGETESQVLNKRIEMVALHRDGHELPVELTVWRVRGGPESRFHAFVQDISTRKEIDNKLAVARDQALEASRLKSRFLASMSHEIRTPMNGVIGLTGLLLHTTLDDNQRRHLEGIRAAGDALLAVTNDVLDFSKIEAGKIVIESIVFDVCKVVREVTQLVTEEADNKGLELASHCDPAIPAVVQGDPGRLRQVLLNLASNAVKFTDRGSVLVRAELVRPEEAGGKEVDGKAGTDSSVVRFSVTDTGVGIASNDAERMFEPFAQADESTTRRYGGTGLGLAISRQLTEAMGGTLAVTSELGAGTTFTCIVTLLAAGPQPGPAPMGAKLTGLPILVVDDKAGRRRLLERQLRAWSLCPDGAEDAGSALSQLALGAEGGQAYQFVLLEDSDEGMTATELARRIAVHPDIPAVRVILLSRKAWPDVPEGVTAVLDTTVDSAALHHCLVRLVASPAAAPDGTRGRVLLVEDNAINQLVAVGVLDSLGYTTDLAHNGAEALEMVTGGRYDVVLMDCRMPIMDGYEATTALRAMEGAARQVPIIAMTASALVEDRRHCLAAGMDDYLSKPISPETLEEVLTRWIERPTAAPAPARPLPPGADAPV